MTEANPAVLDVIDLVVNYGSRRVVDGVSIRALEPGSVTALVGPNAAGKSTLLRALAGLVPLSGTINLGAMSLQQASVGERGRQMSFMPQSLPASVPLSVLESVIAALRASSFDTGKPTVRASAIEEQAIAQLTAFGIEDLALRPLSQLSGGQRQLAGLAQAVVREPQVLLLDEPTSALDLKHQHRVMRLVRAFSRSGRIVIVVLHDLAVAAQFADRLVVLRAGRLYADGSIAEVLTPTMLHDVYGVKARVETCSRGRVTVLVDDDI